MASFLIRRTVWDGLTADQKSAWCAMPEELLFGEPALLIDPDSNIWCCFDDSRFTVQDAALGAIILTNLAEFPDFDPGESENIHADCLAFCQNHDLIWPVELSGEEENPFQTAYEAQGGPATMRIEMGATWPPYIEE